MQWTELVVFSVLFLLVTVLGFFAARWKAGDTLEHLDEWGLGGRKFGSWITWFLVGGDLYTAYTFVAVPALVYIKTKDTPVVTGKPDKLGVDDLDEGAN